MLNPAHRGRYHVLPLCEITYTSFISRSGLAGLAAQNCSVEPVQSGVGASCGAWPWYSATRVLSVSFLVKLVSFGWVRKGPDPHLPAGPRRADAADPCPDRTRVVRR